MKKILIISDDEQDNAVNLIGSEGLRIKSHCENIFSSYLVDVFTKNPRKNHKKGNINYINSSEEWILKNISAYEAMVLFQNSHFSSFTYKLAKKKLDIKTIVDLYNPLILEKSTYESNVRMKETEESVRMIISSGDFFFCANQKQKDYYLGVLSVFGKTSGISSGAELISIIPTHLPACHLMENVAKTKDFVFFGGFYPWFNKKEISNFAEKIVKSGFNVTFFGSKNPAVKGDFIKTADALSKQFSGKIAENIFYKEWLPFEKISSELQKYKMAFNFVDDNLEDIYAYRTRFLSLLQSGVPIITNGKDEISESIFRFGAGDKYDSKKKIQEYLMNSEKKSKESKILFELLSKVDNLEKNKVVRFFSNGNFQKKRGKDSIGFYKTLIFFIRKNLI